MAEDDQKVFDLIGGMTDIIIKNCTKLGKKARRYIMKVYQPKSDVARFREFPQKQSNSLGSLQKTALDVYYGEKLHQLRKNNPDASQIQLLKQLMRDFKNLPSYKRVKYIKIALGLKNSKNIESQNEKDLQQKSQSKKNSGIQSQMIQEEGPTINNLYPIPEVDQTILNRENQFKLKKKHQILKKLTILKLNQLDLPINLKNFGLYSINLLENRDIRAF